MAQKQAQSEQPMSDFAKGFDYPMYVITAVDGGERSGCLIGFATQCSLKPALFLVCISKQNHTHPVALDAGVLAVHVLARSQRALAELFGETTWTSSPAAPGSRARRTFRCWRTRRGSWSGAS
jgi:flavin reductase (DIM6/NTAB) family NADH-FMN oxidoreductase RutF